MTEKENLVYDEESAEDGYGSVSVDTETPESAVDSESTLGVQPLHIMLASFVGSIGIVFGVIPILIPSQSFELLHLDIIPYIGRAFCSMVLLSLSTFFITWRSRDAITEKRCISAKALLKTLKDFCGFVVYQCPALIQILVFATGSMATCGLDIYNHSNNDHIYKSPFIVEDTIRMLSLASQMVFYSWFMYDRPRQLPRGYYAAIALMIGAEAWLWISDTTEPLWTVNTSYTEPDKTDEQSQFAEGVEQFLEPFHIEFSTISIGLLYELLSLVPGEKNCTEERGYPSVSVSRYHKFISVILFVLYVAVSTSILFACPYCDNKFIMFLRLMIYCGILFILYGVFLISVTVKALLRLTSSYKKSSDASLSQYLLIITAIVMFVFYILRIFAAGYDLHDDIKHYHNRTNVSLEAGEELFASFRSVTLQKHWIKIPYITFSEVVVMDGVMLTYPFFIIVQVWVQTQFLIEAQRHKIIPKFVQIVLVYIIMMNFAEWLQTGLSLGFDRDGKSAHTTPIMDEFFSDKGGRIIRLCLYPFMILYRFHSAVVAWEILIENGNEDDGNKEKHEGEEREE